MLSFLKENGFPMTIHIETSDYEYSPLKYNGYESIVTDADGNEISRFTHKEYHDRAHWANGFFTGLKHKRHGTKRRV